MAEVPYTRKHALAKLNEAILDHLGDNCRLKKCLKKASKGETRLAYEMSHVSGVSSIKEVTRLGGLIFSDQTRL